MGKTWKSIIVMILCLTMMFDTSMVNALASDRDKNKVGRISMPEQVEQTVTEQESENGIETADITDIETAELGVKEDNNTDEFLVDREYYKPYPEATYDLGYYIQDDGTICITGSKGKCEHDLIIPNEIDGHSVTTIGGDAFCECSGFTGSLTIPSSVTNIGDYAFNNCSGLNGNLTIPNSVTTIANGAFHGCSGLTGNLTIPNSVTSMGGNAFAGCSGFTGNLTIPNSVTSIGSYAFWGCSGFTGLTIPNSVTSIGGHAFVGCSGFTGNLTIPNSVTSIGHNAFTDCSGFTGNLTIPNSVTSIGSYVFYGCSGFTGLTIPDSVTTIGRDVFIGCSGLAKVVNGSSIAIGLPSVDGKIWKNEKTGETVTSIANGTAIRSDYKSEKKEYNYNDEIAINYAGYAVAHVHLVDEKGAPLVNAGEELVYSTSAANWPATVNNNHCIDVHSDLYIYSANGNNKHKFTTYIKNKSGKEVAIVNINNILVKNISYSQKWTGKMDFSGEASVGPGVKADVGLADVEASLADVSATGSIANTVAIENKYIEGVRNLNLKQSYDLRVGAKGNVGPKLKAISNSSELGAMNISGNDSGGYQVSSGLNIQNYNPENASDVAKIGDYMLYGSALSSGNVYLLRLYEALGKDVSDIVSEKVSYEHKKAINVLPAAKVDMGVVSAEASALSEEGRTVFFEATRERSNSSVTYTKRRKITTNENIDNLKMGISGWKKLPITSEVKYTGPVAGEVSVQDISVRGKINSLSDKNISKDSIDKISYSSLMYNKGGLNIHEKHEEVTHETVYSDNNAKIIVQAVPGIGDFYTNFIHGLTDENIKAIEQCKAAEATFSENYKETESINFPFKAGKKVLVGGKVEFNFKGISEESYDIDGGLYNYNEVINDREEITTNKCDSLSVEKRINETKSSLPTILFEPLESTLNLAVNKVKDLAGKAGESIKNGFASIVNHTIKSTVHIARLYSKSDVQSVDSDSMMSQSYEIYTYSDTNTQETAGATDAVESVASTVGEPYIIYLTDADGNDVSDWNGETVTLVLEYTDEMLEAAGASSMNASSLAIYQYSQEKLGYIYRGGVVDTTNKTVTLEIGEEGQYILAIDNVAPVVTVFTTKDDSNPPVIIAGLDEMSGLSEFSLKLDGEELVNLNNFDQYYDVNSRAIKYPVKDSLSLGKHKATLFAADAVGNKMASPAELEIVINDTVDVQFDANGGTVSPAESKFAVGEKYGDLPTPIREGYSFVGWFTEKTGGIHITSETIVEDKSIRCLYAHWSELPTYDTVLDPEMTTFTLIPGEIRRLSVSKSDQYIYGIKWVLNSASPKGCITLKNGVVTAKKTGTARVTATYGSSLVTFNIIVDGETHDNTVIQEGKKKYKITATKNITTTVGDNKKTVTIGIPKNLRAEGRTINYEVLTDGVCSVGTPTYNKADLTKATKATFNITPLDAGASWIVWSMTDDNGNKTQATTKVIVKKPITDLQFSETSVDINAGEGKLLTVTGTKDNTDANDLSFSVKGKGVKVSKSGFVVGTIPGSTATVTVKYGKTQASTNVRVSGDPNRYLTLNKNTVNVALPKPGAKAKTTTIGLAMPKKKIDQPKVRWAILGSPSGITVKDGKISVESSASPGCYVIVASPIDSTSGYNSAFCELVVK